ncbi:DUF2185 domain-containing protein, partial [Vibrio parahaemolyticus]
RLGVSVAHYLTRRYANTENLHMAKNFKLSAENIRELASGYGGCIATDMITVVGKKVGYFYRVEPNYNLDSGWCFMSGDETQEYMDEPTNHEIYDVNTIANYDPDIIPFLDAPVGSAFERNSEGKIAEIVE